MKKYLPVYRKKKYYGKLLSLVQSITALLVDNSLTYNNKWFYPLEIYTEQQKEAKLKIGLHSFLKLNYSTISQSH